MTEIELKAHVDNRTALIQKLNSFATYEGAVTRDDTYYASSKKKGSIKIRIRRETRTGSSADTGSNSAAASNNNARSTTTTGSSATAVTWLVTYKRKETRTDEKTGTIIEVNDEKECQVSSPEPLVAFLLDTGYFVDLKKHKEVQDWTLPLPATLLTGNALAEKNGCAPKADALLAATFELCAVPPLGDFLEIEVLAPLANTPETKADDEKIVARIHHELELLLEKAGIPSSKIENRYYSEMLKALRSQQ